MKTFFRSFAGGEITPEMFGRIDLPKFQTGLRGSLNFETLPHGPAARRPGYQFVAETRDSSKVSRLIPFVYNAEQAMMLEFGDFTVRFHNADGTLLETAKTVDDVTNANPGVFTVTGHGWSDGDWVFLTTMTDMETLSNRFFIVDNVTTNTFTLTDLFGVVIDTSALDVYPGGGFAARVYTVTSPYAADQLAALDFAQNSDVLTLTHSLLATRELRRLGATNWQFSTVSFVPTLAVPTGVTCVAFHPTPTNMTAQHYVVTAVAADLVTESLQSADATDTNNLSIAGNFNTISWSASVGAARYYVYKLRGGIYGFIGQTTTTSLIDDNIEPDTTTPPPESNITLNTGAGDFPAAVTYYERRRWFAAPANKLQSIFATRNATESNLTSSIPSRADDALEFRIAAQQQNAIRYLVPLTDIVALTVGGEFRIFADGGPSIALDTLSIKPQGFSGAAAVRPVLTDRSALYVQALGSRVREIAYDPTGLGAFRTTDVSLLATHLFDGYTLRELAYARAPEALAWATRSDGALLGLSHVPDQNVYGWHRHTTQGTFESVAVIPENGEDVLYAIVRRNIGSTGLSKRYIERRTPRRFGAIENAFFVDAGLTYNGPATTTVTGLHHLKTALVHAVADGAAVVGLQVGLDGTLELPYAAEKITVGLGYTSDLTTLPLVLEQANALGQGANKNVSEVYLRVSQSSVVKAGPNFADLTEYPAREVSDPYDAPPSLKTGEIALVISPDWNADGTVCVRQDLPLPLTVVAMALEVAEGG